MSLLRKALAALPLEQRRPLVESHLVERVSRSLGRSVAPDELGQPLSSIGLDSLLAVELQHAVETDFGVSIPMVEILQAENFHTLTDEIAGRFDPDLDPATLRIPRSGKTGSHPLTPAQEGLWYLDRLEGSSATYNVSSALRLRGPLSVGALRDALSEIVRRHAALRTVFRTEGHRPVQVVREHSGVDLLVVDAPRGVDATRFVESMAAEESGTPFALDEDRLLRCRLLRLAPDEHVLLVTIHHIVSDGWSMVLFLDEVAELYPRFADGSTSTLDPLEIDFVDVARWIDEGHLAVAGDDVSWWRDRLADAPTLHALPSDQARPPIQSFEGETAWFELGEELSGRIRELARNARTTPYVVLQAAFAALLGQESSTDDVVLGCPAAGRSRPEVDRLIGFFANTLPIRIDLSDDPTVEELLGRAREVNLGALQREHVPFERLVEVADHPRSPAHGPLVQAMFVFQPAAPDGVELGPVRAYGEKLSTGTAKFDLLLAMEEGARGFAGGLEYATRLFDQSFAHGLIERFTSLLDSATARPGARLSEVIRAVDKAPFDSAEALEGLRSIPTVLDAHVGVREDAAGASVSIAWVVLDGVEARSLRSELSTKVRATSLPDHFVPVTRIPRDAQGSVDAGALNGLPLLTDRIALSWEAHGFERGAPAVVLPREPEAEGRTVLLDADPQSESGTDVGPGVSSSESDRRTDPSRMAFAEGGPLTIPDDAPRTLTAALHRAAREHPGHGITYVDADGNESSSSYPELLEDAKRVLAGLRAAGLEAGDSVILQIQDLPDHFPTWWGCALGGIVPVTVAVPPVYEEGVAVVQKLLNTWELLDRPAILASAAVIEPLEALEEIVDGSVRTLSVAALRANEPTNELHDVQPGDLAFFQLTSGSTGVPKCIQEVHEKIVAHVHGAAAFNGYTSDDVSLNWLLMDHVVPILTCHLKDTYLGCNQVMVSSAVVLSDPLRWLDLIEQHRVTHTWSPNFGFNLVAHAVRAAPERSWDLSSMKFFMNAGEQVTLPVVRDFLESTAPFGVESTSMQPAFGMAEVCTCMTWQNDFTVGSGVHHVKKDSLGDQLVLTESTGSATVDFVHLGPPHPGVQIRIADDHNETLPEGRIGRFQIRGDVVTPGYLKNDPANAEAFVGDGWFNSGDLGYILDGNLVLTGREKEIIIVHGANYYCYEVEHIVGEVDGVAPGFAAAVGIQDPATGTESLGVFFSPDDASADTVEIVQRIRPWVSERLGITPSVVVPIPLPDFPKTTSGKIQRMKLKNALLEGAFEETLEKIRRDLGVDGALPAWFHRVEWGVASPAAVGVRDGRPVVLLPDAAGLGDALHARLEAAGRAVEVVTAAADAGALGDVLTGLASTHPAVGINVVDCRAYSIDRADAHAHDFARHAIAVRDLLPVLSGHEVDLFVVTAAARAVDVGDEIDASVAPFSGFLKSVDQEYTSIRTQQIDLEGADPADDARHVFAELGSISFEADVAYRGGVRKAPSLTRVDWDEATVEPAFEAGGRYVVTGGLGGVGQEVCRELLDTFDARLFVLGRSDLDAASDKLAALSELRRWGAVEYRSADLASSEDVRAALDEVRQRWGGIDGVVHLAGVLEEAPASELTAETLERALSAKVTGTHVLHDALLGESTARLLLFSSVNALFGGVGASAYSAANAYVEEFARSRVGRDGPDVRCLTWTSWDGTGMSGSSAPALRAALRSRGFHTLRPADAVASMRGVLSRGLDTVVVGLDDDRPAIRARLADVDVAGHRLVAFTAAEEEWRGLSSAVSVSDRFETGARPDVVVLDPLPMDGSGQVDRAAVRAWADEGGAGSELIEPTTEAETTLFELWEELLPTARFGVTDSFFSVGGHSLLATQLVSRVTERFERSVSVRELFEHPTIRSLASLLEAGVEGSEVRGPIPTVSRGESLALSYAQERLWVLEEMEAGSGDYEYVVGYQIRGHLDEEAFDRAYSALLQRHEILRTHYPSRGGRAVQEISQEPHEPLHRIDARSHGLTTRSLHEVAAHVPEGALDLLRGPVVRSGLVRVDDDEWIFVVFVHHIVADGWSLGVMARDMGALYDAFARGVEAELSPLPAQYADYAAWHRTQLSDGRLERQLEYWLGRLDGAPELLGLPTDHPRPVEPSGRGGVHTFRLNAGETTSLDEYARAGDATLFMVLFAAFELLLSRYSGETDLCIGTDVANRGHPDAEELIGFFVNQLVIRSDLSGDPTSRALLSRVRESVLSAFANQDLPFEQLVKAVNPDRERGITPLFQAKLVLNNTPQDRLDLGAVSIEPLPMEIGGSKFDLLFNVARSGVGLDFSVEYNADLFEEATIERMARHYRSLVTQLAAHPDTRVGDLAMLTVDEAEWVRDFNQTAETIDVASLGEQLAARAAEAPDRIAIRANGHSMTWAEFDRRSSGFAELLEERGVGADQIVGVYMDRSLDLVIALAGIVRTGAAYLPLDPTHPKDRTHFVVSDAAPRLIITTSELATDLEGLDGGADILRADAIDFGVPTSWVPARSVSPDSLAYVIYTSGSTGRPKGTLLTQLGVANYLGWATRTYGLDSGASPVLHSPLGFDLTVTSLWGPLVAGHSVDVLAAETSIDDLGTELARRSGQTVLKVTPSHLAVLQHQLEPGDAAGLCETLVVGGDQLTTDAVAWWTENAPATTIVNEYGPTETVVGCCVHTVSGTEAGPAIPIGHPIANTRLHVVDYTGKLAGAGVPGELLIAGDGLARGYLGRPGLTAERFVPDAFSNTPGSRAYRSGDLVRSRGAVGLEYVGRVDSQVKVRGFRVELGEIEALLAEAPGCAQAAVVLADRSGGSALVGYFEAPSSVSVEETRAYLAERLPDYMVPSALVRVDSMPLTANGKVDRRALPAADTPAEVVSDGAPRTETERTLVTLWSDFLERDDVGIHDDFFELGGDSILSLQIVAQAIAAGLPLTSQQLFENPTIAQLSELLGDGGDDATPAEGSRAGAVEVVSIEPIDRAGELELSFAQERLWFLDQLEPGQSIYNIPASVRVSGNLNLLALDDALADVVRRHEALRTTFPLVDERPVQRISGLRMDAASVVDVRGLSVDLERLSREEAHRPFDLAEGPLLRTTVLQTDDEEYVILFTIHHVVSDGWSVGVLVNELSTLYESFSTGRPSTLAELRVQYPDFAAWQRAWHAGPGFKDDLEYWARQLTRGPPPTDLPADHERPDVETLEAESATFTLPKELHERLRAWTREERATPFMTLLTVMKTLIGKYTGDEEVVVGTDIANRHHSGVEDLIGFFVNILVLRTDLSGDPTFVEASRRVRDVAHEAYAHQDMPFDKLVEELKPERHRYRPPFFQLLFVMQNAPGDPLELPGLQLSPPRVLDERARFDLAVFVTETDSVEMHWVFKTDLFESSTIARMAREFETLLTHALAAPETALSALEVRSADEVQAEAEKKKAHFDSLGSRKRRRSSVNLDVLSGDESDV